MILYPVDDFFKYFFDFINFDIYFIFTK